MKKEIVLAILAIILVVVISSGCIGEDNKTANNTNSTGSGELQNAINISDVTITKAEYGDGYDANLKLTYTGDKPINYRLVIEPYPMTGETQGKPEIPEQLIQSINKGDSFNVSFKDIGDGNFTGFKFRVGVNYEKTDKSTTLDDQFFTTTYNN